MTNSQCLTHFPVLCWNEQRQQEPNLHSLSSFSSGTKEKLLGNSSQMGEQLLQSKMRSMCALRSVLLCLPAILSSILICFKYIFYIQVLLSDKFCSITGRNCRSAANVSGFYTYGCVRFSLFFLSLVLLRILAFKCLIFLIYNIFPWCICVFVHFVKFQFSCATICMLCIL